jgi:hypothetical protein
MGQQRCLIAQHEGLDRERSGCDYLSVASRSEYLDIIEQEFAASLGAIHAPYREKLTLFIAHRDRDGNDVSDLERWIAGAESVLSQIGGGATSIEARGAWLGDRATPLHERTTLVFTHATPEQIVEGVPQLRHFMHAYGRETRQWEVAVLLENQDGHWFIKVLHENYD